MDQDRARVGGCGCGVLGASGVMAVRDKVLLIVVLALVLVFPFILDSRGYRLQQAINLQTVLLMRRHLGWLAASVLGYSQRGHDVGGYDAITAWPFHN